MRIFLVIGLLFSCLHGVAQNLSNTGKEFWVAYGHHQFMEPDWTPNNTQQMVLYLNATQPARVTVTIDSSTTGWTRTYNIPANTVIVTDFIPKAGFDDARLFTMPPSFGGTGGEGIFRGKGIHIVSDVPIVAYAHIYGSLSSGATMLMPVETWGYNSISLNSQQNYAANCYSWMYVIAKQDSTVVEIKPAALTRLGKPAGVPFQVMLMKGQVYQLIGANAGGSAGYELTGTTVTSIANPNGKCYPIAVFSGSSRTAITCTGTSGSGDNNMQQVFPFQAWGKRYLTAPTSNATTPSSLHTNIYKVLVKDPTTIVKKNGAVLSPLINGLYYQYQSNTADYIEADKPILVGQFMSSSGNCPNTGGDGDPEMIYLSPLEQGKKNVGFFRNNREAIRVNYLTLIVPTPGLSSLTIDGVGSAGFSHQYAHPNLPGYTVVVKRWSITPGNDPSNPPPPGQCLVNCDSAFTAITYGLGGVESYGYNAGANINNLAATPFIHNEPDPTVPSHAYTCRNTPVEISMLVAYKPSKIVWRVSQLASVITPNTDVTDNDPQVLDSVIYNNAKYYKYRLPGTYTFSQAGTYEIPVQNTHFSLEGCNNTEEVLLQIVVKPSPKADFSYVHNSCITDTAQFSSPASSGNGYTIGRWEWTFPDGSTSTLSNPVKKFNTVGIQPIKLKVISTEGCVGDTTRNIEIFDKPKAVFGTTPTSICEGSNIVFTDTSTYAGSTPITSWYWDFGNGNIVTASDASPQNEVYPGYGTFTVKHVVKVGTNACVSDTATKIVTVYAKPRLGFTYPAGCLPVDGIVQFTSTTTTPDGQALTDYSWDFGDQYADASNPNTSTLPNPTHMYSVFGNYTIFYSVTTANGCGKDTVVQASFNLRPVMTFANLPSVCENQTGAVSVALANVTNGVTGTGVYKGAGTNATGNFDPAAAGFGLHTIWYVFTSTGGCKDSISQTIMVNAKPRVRFTYPAGGCLPIDGLVQFNNFSTIADPQSLSYSWDFGDPNATTGNPNTSTAQNPTHNYIDGNYTIKLTVTSANGCSADSTANTIFSLRPQLSYPALNAICESVTGTVSVATATVTNGSTGTGRYWGPGTDATGNFSPSSAGWGTHTIWYVFTTNGGCKDSVSQTILVHAKPGPWFTHLPATGCLPPTGIVSFQNGTTINDGQPQLLTYAWDFGDPNATTGNPNTSTLFEPTHSFREGTYSIKLTATTSNGCTSSVTRSLTFGLRPLLDYPTLPAVCQSQTGTVSVATATTTNGVTGTGVYRGPGTDAAGNFNPSTAGAGTHTIWYVFTSAGGCKDSISQTILVHAKPAASFTISPTGCLPINGQVTFTNGSTISDGQPITYAWDFGDPNATTGNPNTSTAQNPTHNYKEGTYNIVLTVTTSNGCTATATRNTALSVKPQLAYGPLPSSCQSVLNTVSVATATVVNGVTGTGVYRGPGTDAAGNFNPSTAGAGTHTIWYVFTTAGGCKDSVSSTIKVLPKPTAVFTATPDVCLGQSVTITDNSIIPAGRIVSWQWDFGNGNNATYNNGNPFSVTYANYNNYQVRLVAVSDSGCVSDAVTKTVNVHPLPLANFDLPASICMPDGIANFINRTSVPDNSALNYQWNFGDGSPVSTVANPAHTYLNKGPFTIMLTATSAHGCRHDTLKVLSAFYDKPTAAFSVSPDTLCQGTDNVFTDLSSPVDSINTWNWSFGDGSSSTARNPSKRYSLPGNYTVSLTVTSKAGCVSTVFTDKVIVYLQPVIDAGPSFVVPQGTIIQFNPKANDSTVLSFAWNPPFGLSNANTLRPTLMALRDETYRLTATGQGNCTATDILTVKILKPVKVPNAFSPNGDGINDKWVLENLSDYAGSTVEVFNRYGQMIFRGTGQTMYWDGTYNGKPLPVATYYYVIRLNNGFPPMTGSVTIIK